MIASARLARKGIGMGRAKASGTDWPEQTAISVLMISLGAVWLGWLMAPRWAALASGPICSHTAFFGAQCPACWAALCLIGVGGALAASRLRPRAETSSVG
jgi:hypothetical protein